MREGRVRLTQSIRATHLSMRSTVLGRYLPRTVDALFEVQPFPKPRPPGGLVARRYPWYIGAPWQLAPERL